MALNFDLSQVKKRLGDDLYEQVTTHPEDLGKEKKRWHPVSDSLVWMSMNCGYHEITEANALEVARRVATVQNKDFERLEKSPDFVWITMQGVWNHIGLNTNAATLTRSEFVKEWGPLVPPKFGRSAQEIIAQSLAA